MTKDARMRRLVWVWLCYGLLERARGYQRTFRRDRPFNTQGGFVEAPGSIRYARHPIGRLLSNDNSWRLYATPVNQRQEQQEAASSSASINSPAAEDASSQRTLYEILGADPSESRAELKARYVKLARVSHPDANIGKNTTTADAPDFTEIAAAWRILSDSKQRKRYDRSLQAEQFSLEVQKVAAQAARQAAPGVKSFGKVALPFLRRTTAATLASFQAAAKELARSNDGTSSGDSSSERSAFRSAMQAARRAGRYVDSLELYEKSQALEERARQDVEKATEIQQQLQAIAEERLQMVLYTPGSGLTASEAKLFWSEFNRTHDGTVQDVLSLWERAVLHKHTVEWEISELEKIEADFVATQAEDSKAQRQYQLAVEGQMRANQQVVQAEQQVEAAQRALEEAEERLAESKDNVETAASEVAQSEAQSKKGDYEMESKSQALMKQSEKVRLALRHKEREVLEKEGADFQDDAEADEARLRRLKDLRREERVLSQRAGRLTASSTRLLSRAQKLSVRAEELEKMQD